VGVFHLAAENTLRLWGLEEGSAEAFAIVFWVVSFVPVSVAAVLLSWREGLSLRGLAAPRAPSAEPADPDPAPGDPPESRTTTSGSLANVERMPVR
jgi:hypothetical protein